MLACAAQNLPAIDFRLPENGADLGVFVLKHLPKQKNRALNWCESLKQDQEGHRECFVDSDKPKRIIGPVSDKRFREPVSGILFALHSRGLQLVDAEATDDGD